MLRTSNLMQRYSKRNHWIHHKPRAKALGFLFDTWQNAGTYWGKPWGYKKKHLSNERCSLVGIPGLEPGMTGPESVVLPLHHIPILLLRQPFERWSWDTRTRTRNDRTRICSVTITPYPNIIATSTGWFLNCECKGTTFFWITKIFRHFFLKYLNFFYFSWVFRVFSVSLYHNYI